MEHQKFYFYISIAQFTPFQYFRLAIVGALVENSASHCLRRLLINIEWGDRGDCKNVTLVSATIVWKLKTPKKVYSWEVLINDLFLRFH